MALANPLTADKWKPASVNSTITIDAGSVVDTDYIGIAAHTFARDSAVLTIAYSNDDVTYTDLTSISASDNKPIMVIFDTVAAQFWRITIAALAIPSMGVLNIGTALVMQRGLYGGHSPVTMSRNSKVIRNKTEGGQFAGVSLINEGVNTTYSWENLTSTWYRDNFDPFVVAARSRPFFIAWRPVEFPNEVGYVWTENDISPTNNGTIDLMDVSMSVSGFSDE